MVMDLFLENNSVREDENQMVFLYHANMIPVCGDEHQHKFPCDYKNDGLEVDIDELNHQTQNGSERKIYWESQQFLLQEILDQYNSNGSNLREHIKRQIDLARESNFCHCREESARRCIKCLRRVTINQLSTKGVKAKLCTSKWKRSKNIPGGTHEYIEVIVSTHGKRKQIPFVIELEFRDEFRMAKACDEYLKLINQLPEIYIGKAQHLNAIVRLVCESGKKSTDELNIHMGPWRKTSFMQMKWSASNGKKIHDQSSNEIGITTTSSSRQENITNVATSFKLDMAKTTVGVA